jgi:hypothetical protein
LRLAVVTGFDKLQHLATFKLSTIAGVRSVPGGTEVMCETLVSTAHFDRI